MALSRRALSAIALGIGCLAGLLIAEVFARVVGQETWTPILELDARPFVAMREPDAVVGWRNRPGTYESPPYVPGGEGSTVRIWADGSRATGPVERDSEAEVVFVGGSFVFGQGVSDHETAAWRLQERDSERNYANFGVSAYGTYQSLLQLEGVLGAEEAAEVVVYGLIDHHRTRNVGRTGWIRHLSRFSTIPVALPYCTLDGQGRLVRHPPERYPAWPLRRWLASVNFVLDTGWDIAHDARFQDRWRVTELLLLEMAELCERRGVELVVALLGNEEPGPSADAGFLEENGIRFADCRFWHTPELRVEGEGHPNAAGHGKWMECLADVLWVE